MHLHSLVRSLEKYLDGQWILPPPPPPTRSEQLIGEYRDYLVEVRGFAKSTIGHHARTAREFLAFLKYDLFSRGLDGLRIARIEAFIKTISRRLSRESLQHALGNLRSFLVFLQGRRRIPARGNITIDSPRIYRGERLPRSLPWKTVQAFLAAIDRSPMGRRDYAVFLLIATYGLRSSEVVALRLEDIGWRSGRLQVRRPKTKDPILLPLTREVGAAIASYLKHDRPDIGRREVFLSYQGPHCLRHSLAVHLLREGTSIKTLLAEYGVDPSVRERLFRSHRGEPLTRFGVGYLLRKYVIKAASSVPTLRTKRVHPHVMRHTTAVHLLQAGVDLVTISHWLGHASIETTNRYTAVDLKMKRAAVAKARPGGAIDPAVAAWRTDSTILDWLEAL